MSDACPCNYAPLQQKEARNSNQKDFTNNTNKYYHL